MNISGGRNFSEAPGQNGLFTYMDDGIYEIAIAHSKDNPFKKYLEFLKELDELNQDEEVFLQRNRKRIYQSA